MSTTGEPDQLSPTKRALLEIRDLRQRLTEMESSQRTPVAIVGAGIRFPGGVRDLDGYWRLLAEGVDAIGPIPPDRWDFDAYFDPEPGAPGRMYTRWGGFLNGIAEFDPYFFDISPREAERMDPQQRLLLETSWEALERAGIAADGLAGGATGVFIGMANSDYYRLLASDPETADLYMSTGSAFSVAAGRISYALGTTGPSLTVDTACSSSLVALHLAVQSLRSKECNLALAGGVNLILSPEANISFSQARMMSVDGRCKTFDESADGYVRSEGCGVVVLKRLDEALQAGNNVLAVIRGTAVNQDGRSNGLTAPNGRAQAAVIRAALDDAGLQPSQVHYVETHGTGTSLGDPIEVGALGEAFSERGESGPLLIGAVKSNLGHMEAAAGIGGLLKVALMLQHGQIPATLHLTSPSSHIDWDELPIDVPTALTPWPTTGVAMVAGLSSFGFSGTNAHVILEAAPVTATDAPELQRDMYMLPLSAHGPEALSDLARHYAAHLRANPDLRIADVEATVGQGRAHHAQRMVVLASDSTHAAERLGAAADTFDVPGVIHGRARSSPPEVAFLFTGQGAQFVGMGRSLYETAPAFRKALDVCAGVLATQIDRPLLDVLFADPDGPDADLLDQTVYTQPALFAFEYALAQLWQAWGVRPSVVAGHSLGEYVAACVAGVFSLEDALQIVVARGRLMSTLPAGGAMLAVFGSEARVEHVLGPLAFDVSVAAVNGPTSVVLSGSTSKLEEAAELLANAEIQTRLLAIPLAAHSPQVEPILDEFDAVVAAATPNAPRIALVSCLTGGLVSDEVQCANYWRRHLREPVRFGDALQTMTDLGCSAFIEIGPHPVLLGMARHAISGTENLFLPSMRRDTGAWEQMLESLGTLYVSGGTIDWAAYSAVNGARRIDLPTYPFQRRRYWAASTPDHAVRSTDDQWGTVLSGARRQSMQGPIDLDAATYPVRWEALDRLASAYILRCLRTMNVFVEDGEQHSVDDLIQNGTIVAGYRTVVARWFNRLASDGLLLNQGGRFTSPRALPEPELEAALARATSAMAGIEPLLDYATRSGSRLVAVLRGEISPLDLLFPGGSYATSDFMYQEWAVARYVSGIVRAAVEARVHAAPGRKQRLLEIGAGTGGTTAQVLPALPADLVTYDFTDVSDFFLARARERFADYASLRYGLLDIEQPTQEQGFAQHSYDVVIAANVLHATRDLDSTLSHVRELLAPGGLLLLLEATQHPHWFDITIGLVEGWQSFDDDWRTDVPLISSERWNDALLAAGFSEVTAFPEAGSITENLGQHVMLARAPGNAAARSLNTAHGDEALIVQSAPESNGHVRHEENAVLVQLEEAMSGERHAVLATFVGSIVARVLRADADRAIAHDQRLQDVGLDSLMAVELRDRLGRSLELQQQLPATIMFDYPSIASIAGYLEREVLWPAEELRPTPEVQTARAPVLTHEHIVDLSDEEMEQLLVQKLERL